MAGRSLTLTISAFGESQPIPSKYSCDGSNVSPALQWSNVPDGTKSFALVVDDPDAPNTTFTHWVLFDIPAETRSLAEGQRAVGIAGRNDFQQEGYGGPCPPANHDAHRYFFRLYALDVESLGLSQGARKEEALAAMQGHILEQTQLMGRYKRRSG